MVCTISLNVPFTLVFPLFTFIDKPANLGEMPNPVEPALLRREWLYKHIQKYLEEFVFDQTLPTVSDNVDPLHQNKKEGYKCRYPGCDKSYIAHSWRVRLVTSNPTSKGSKIEKLKLFKDFD